MKAFPIFILCTAQALSANAETLLIKPNGIFSDSTQGTLQVQTSSATSSLRVEAGDQFFAENICAGKKIFGKEGETPCLAENPENLFPVMAPRKNVSLLNLSDLQDPSLQGRKRATLKSGKIRLSEFLAEHDLVPDPVYTSDATNDPYALDIARRHDLEILAGRPQEVCGLKGTLGDRIHDCEQKNGVRAYYNGTAWGVGSEGDWRLVVRSESGKEVWRDERTRLLWSDKVNMSGNWYMAAGVRSGSQTSPPTSFCTDASFFPEEEGLENFVTPESTHESKGYMGAESSPKVFWRLPTMNDWLLAHVNGIQRAVPREADTGEWNQLEWVLDGNGYGTGSYGWLVQVGGVGVMRDTGRSGARITRCVGRVYEGD